MVKKKNRNSICFNLYEGYLGLFLLQFYCAVDEPSATIVFSLIFRPFGEPGKKSGTQLTLSTNGKGGFFYVQCPAIMISACEDTKAAAGFEIS